MHQDESEHLISRYLDGTIDAHELAKLEKWLDKGDHAAERFAEWCLMHGQITDVMSEDRLHELIDQILVGRPGPQKSTQNPMIAQRNGHPVDSWDGQAWWWVRMRAATAGAVATAVAATVALLLFGLGKQTNTASSTHSSATNGLAAADTRVVASLTQIVDAKWNSPGQKLESGQLLSAGDRLQLAAGHAKVTFDCGAELVLQGPCDLELKSRMAGLLYSGRLTADVPPRAFGFGIICPGVDLVDLGTSFGVNVADGGATELHVFEGEVLCSPNEPDYQGTRQILHVYENEAKTFRAGDADSSNIPIDLRQFESLRALRRMKESPSRIAASDKLALWLAADGVLSLDEEQRVISCPDILYGGNRSAEDALQPDPDARPLLVADAINGQAAMRFDGDSDFLLTTPLQTTDNQTVLFVCQFTSNAIDDERVWGGQIINYDGPPSRYLSNTLEPGVLQIGEPLLESEFQPTFITAQVFAGFVGATTVEAGRVDGHCVGVNQPVLVAYTYNYASGRAELHIDGRLCGSSRAFAPQGITSRKIIGRHAWMELFFYGDLAEMLIYNKALAPEELSETSLYLADKYSISISGD